MTTQGAAFLCFFNHRRAPSMFVTEKLGKDESRIPEGVKKKHTDLHAKQQIQNPNLTDRCTKKYRRTKYPFANLSKKTHRFLCADFWPLEWILGCMNMNMNPFFVHHHKRSRSEDKITMKPDVSPWTPADW